MKPQEALIRITVHRGMFHEEVPSLKRQMEVGKSNSAFRQRGLYREAAERSSARRPREIGLRVAADTGPTQERAIVLLCSMLPNSAVLWRRLTVIRSGRMIKSEPFHANPRCSRSD